MWQWRIEVWCPCLWFLLWRLQFYPLASAASLQMSTKLKGPLSSFMKIVLTLCLKGVQGFLGQTLGTATLDWPWSVLVWWLLQLQGEQLTRLPLNIQICSKTAYFCFSSIYLWLMLKERWLCSVFSSWYNSLKKRGMFGSLVVFSFSCTFLIKNKYKVWNVFRI